MRVVISLPLRWPSTTLGAAEKQREGATDILHMLVHAPKGWVGTRNQNATQVSQVLERNPTAWAIAAAFGVYIGRTLGLESRAGDQTQVP